MRVFLSAFAIAVFTLTAFAQDSSTQTVPVSQNEFVKMLYALERDPSKKQEIIDALRTRGIGFEVTDGIRGLTSSKSRSDAELKRTLEEAGRRRTNPAVAHKLPSPADFKEAVSKARDGALLALEEMPDFVVKQQIQRSVAYSGTNNFTNLDRLVVAVSYRANGSEEYKVLSLNGAVQNDPKAKSSYEETGGTSSTGEFVTVLSKIFKPESDTKFTPIDTDLLRGRQTVVAGFEITKEKAQQALISAGAVSASTITGMKGLIWIDRENFRVLRIESDATEIPADFPISAARRVIDYDWVTIAEGKYLLPSISDVRLTIREGTRTFDTKNLIRFREYQKYGTEIKILDDDSDEIPAEKKKP